MLQQVDCLAIREQLVGGAIQRRNDAPELATMTAADTGFEVPLGDARQRAFDDVEPVDRMAEKSAREEKEARQADQEQQRGAEQRFPEDALRLAVGYGDVALLQSDQLAGRGDDLQVYGPPVLFQEEGNRWPVICGEKAVKLVQHGRQFGHSRGDGRDQVFFRGVDRSGHRVQISLPGKRNRFPGVEHVELCARDAKIVVEHAIHAHRHAAELFVDLNQKGYRLDFFLEDPAQALLALPAAPHADGGDAGQRHAGEHDQQQQGLADAEIHCCRTFALSRFAIFLSFRHRCRRGLHSSREPSCGHRRSSRRHDPAAARAQWPSAAGQYPRISGWSF